MAETRSAMPVTQALTVGDRSFVGMDTYTDANKLQDGFCQRITNMVVQNGSLVPRRGFQAVTTNQVSSTGWVRSVPSQRMLAFDVALDGYVRVSLYNAFQGMPYQPAVP